MKNALTIAASLGASAAGAAVDVLPYLLRVILVSYVALCACVLLTLFVMRDIRNYRTGR